MQRGLAGVGIADQADVGEQLEREVQRELFAGLARLHLARRAIGGGGEVRVAQPAASALRDAHTLADTARSAFSSSSPVSGSRSADERADRNGDVEVVAVPAVAIGARAVAAALGVHIRD